MDAGKYDGCFFRLLAFRALYGWWFDRLSVYRSAHIARDRFFGRIAETSVHCLGC